MLAVAVVPFLEPQALAALVVVATQETTPRSQDRMALQTLVVAVVEPGAPISLAMAALAL